MNQLSANDHGVLSRIFSANSLDPLPRVQIDLELQPDQHVPTPTVERLAAIEKQAIVLHERGEHQEALRLLSRIIADHPRYASAYNNRAQMLRSARTDGTTAPNALDPASARSMAMSDLATGLSLARSPGPISKMQATVLRSLYGQLASTYLEQSRLPANSDRAWELQMQASDMLVECSNYGESIAAQLAVAVNPYAKLCGNVMQLALSSER